MSVGLLFSFVVLRNTFYAMNVHCYSSPSHPVVCSPCAESKSAMAEPGEVASPPHPSAKKQESLKRDRESQDMNDSDDEDEDEADLLEEEEEEEVRATMIMEQSASTGSTV